MVNPDWDKGLSQPDAELRTVWVDRGMAALFYRLLDESTVTAAFSRLRPQSAYPFMAAFPLSQLPTVSCTYRVCWGSTYRPGLAGTDGTQYRCIS